MPVTGIIQNVTSSRDQCCSQQVTIRNSDGIVNFMVGPETFVADNIRLRPGLSVTAFYDANLPVPLIFPPRYQAAAISRTRPREQIMMDYFDRNLRAVSGDLKLNLDRGTTVETANGQNYTCNPGNNLLLVYYSVTTRSIPPQTTPRRIIVLC